MGGELRWARVEEATGAGDMTSGVDMGRGATNGYIGLDGVLGRKKGKQRNGTLLSKSR